MAHKADPSLEKDCEKAQGKPLYILMDKLMRENENTDDTLIPHEDLLSILKIDFNMNFNELAEVEVESYMEVLKWSLKGWPGWERVDNEDKVARQNTMNKERVFQEYQSVKSYINQQLRIAKRCISSIEGKRNPDRDIAKMLKGNRLVLKVECSKKHLKTLINSKISRKLQLINFIPPKINEDTNRYQWMSFMDVFNWPYLEVHIELPNFSFVHKNISESKYRVVDWKTAQDKQPELLDRSVYCKNILTKKCGVPLDFLVDYLDQVIKYVSDGRRMSSTKKNDLTGLFQEIKKDVLPLKSHITFGTEYKYNLSDYNYSQYLYNPVDASVLSGDDLHEQYSQVQPRLHHTITPAITFCLGRFSCKFTTNSKGTKHFNLGLEVIERVSNNWLRIHCSLCDASITGFLSFHELNTHLAEFHGAENDWLCVKCQKVFNVLELAYRRWSHACP